MSSLAQETIGRTIKSEQKWIDEWSTSDVINHSLIKDPTITPQVRHPSSFVDNIDLFQDRPRSMCCCQPVCWKQASDPSCSCGAPSQSVVHIVNDCPQTKFPSCLSALHLAETAATVWLIQSKCYEDISIYFIILS